MLNYARLDNNKFQRSPDKTRDFLDILWHFIEGVLINYYGYFKGFLK